MCVNVWLSSVYYLRRWIERETPSPTKSKAETAMDILSFSRSKYERITILIHHVKSDLR